MNAILSDDPFMHVRPMLDTDLAQVLDIEKTGYISPWTLNIFRDCLRANYCMYVLEQGQTIIGYGVMSVVIEEAHILNICVHETYRGCGCGKHILEHLLKNARHKGADTAFLEVNPNNHAARKLYINMGFNQVGRRKNYYPVTQNKREDALIMALVL